MDNNKITKLFYKHKQSIINNPKEGINLIIEDLKKEDISISAYYTSNNDTLINLFILFFMPEPIKKMYSEQLSKNINNIKTQVYKIQQYTGYKQIYIKAVLPNIYLCLADDLAYLLKKVMHVYPYSSEVKGEDINDVFRMEKIGKNIVLSTMITSHDTTIPAEYYLYIMEGFIKALIKKQLYLTQHKEMSANMDVFLQHIVNADFYKTLKQNPFFNYYPREIANSLKIKGTKITKDIVLSKQKNSEIQSIDINISFSVSFTDFLKQIEQTIGIRETKKIIRTFKTLLLKDKPLTQLSIKEQEQYRDYFIEYFKNQFSSKYKINFSGYNEDDFIPNWLKYFTIENEWNNLGSNLYITHKISFKGFLTKFSLSGNYLKDKDIDFKEKIKLALIKDNIINELLQKIYTDFIINDFNMFMFSIFEADIKNKNKKDILLNKFKKLYDITIQNINKNPLSQKIYKEYKRIKKYEAKNNNINL